MDPGPASPNQEGPSEAPPPLPEGWLAQWDSSSRKYYYVQRATGHSQWDVPTQPALSVPTPEPTPQAQSPFQRPEAPQYEGADRGLLGDLAVNALSGGKHSQKPQSGFESLASSFLGGQHHGGNSQAGSGSGSGGGSGGMAGQLIGSFLGGKPHGQTSHDGSGGFPSSSSGQHHSSGLSGAAASLFGGSHGSSNQNTYGYTSSGHTSSGGYSGSAPPTSYTPTKQNNNPYGQAQPHQQQAHLPHAGTASYSQQQYPPTANQSYGNPPSSQWGANAPSTYGQQGKPFMDQKQQTYGEHTGQFGTSVQNTSTGQSFPTASSVGQQAPYQNASHQGQYSDYPPPPSQPPNPYNQYPPPPQHTQSFPAPPGQGGSHNTYSSPPPVPSMNTHPGSQAQVIGQASHYASHNYPGQQSYGQAPQAQGYQNPPQPGGYGNDGSQYSAFGAPAPPAWR